MGIDASILVLTLHLCCIPSNKTLLITLGIVYFFRYFEALNKHQTPPVKERLDYQLGQAKDNPVTKGALAVLHKQVNIVLKHLRNSSEKSTHF